ncbi:MAG: hypothetical protein JSV64_00480 [Candidatus Bathyarchaeota archaeon]|nr:MAG: hypothetical protein JSV64_00480 [Candidatus Bathyarchaeota archaeon]
MRAQLPYQIGGLETNVTFVDGGNTFRLYDISHIARLYELNPEKVLERIFISRAFTAYQMTSIILDRLQKNVEQHDSEFVIVSDISGLFLDKDISAREAREVFNQLIIHLSTFAQRNHIVVAATYLPHHLSNRNIFFKTIICGCANVIISTMPCERSQQFILEKHPFFDLGSTNFPSEDFVLTKFMETQTWAKL